MSPLSYATAARGDAGQPDIATTVLGCHSNSRLRCSATTPLGLGPARAAAAVAPPACPPAAAGPLFLEEASIAPPLPPPLSSIVMLLLLSVGLLPLLLLLFSEVVGDPLRSGGQSEAHK